MLQHIIYRAIVFFMSDVLKKRIKQSSDFESPVNKAILNLMVATDYVRVISERICAEFNITPGQYNVLRILRGAGYAGHPRYEITERMVERAPDVTRLIDRLEKQDLVVRDCCSEDKRRSITRITGKGLKLLDEMQPKVDEMTADLSEKVSLPEWIALSGICEKIYKEKE